LKSPDQIGTTHKCPTTGDSTPPKEGRPKRTQSAVYGEGDIEETKKRRRTKRESPRTGCHLERGSMEGNSMREMEGEDQGTGL